MTRIVKQENGNTIAIGIYADNETELQRWFNLFFNFSATSGELNVESDLFGWFTTTTDTLKHGLQQIALNHVLLSAKHGLEFKGHKLGAMPLARRAARLWFARIPSERIMPERELNSLGELESIAREFKQTQREPEFSHSARD